MTATEHDGGDLSQQSREDMQKQYETAIAELTPTQVAEVERGNEAMCTLFPTMAHALRLYRALCQRQAEDAAAEPQVIISPVGWHFP